MNFDEIKFTEIPVPVSAEEVRDFEDKFWVKFPKGYLEYITKFGEGTLASTVRIYPPRRIETDLEIWRQRIKDYWFWDNDPILLPKERALESIILGDTLDGDEIVFHPSFPEKIFILPHEEEYSVLGGSDLFEVIKNMSNEIDLEELNSDFEPFDSRNFERNYDAEFQSPKGESLEDIMKRIEEWVIRNFARTQADKMLRENVKADYEANLINEGVYLRTEKMDIGYFLNYEVFDKNTHKKIGVFRFNKNPMSYGCDWTPQ